MERHDRLCLQETGQIKEKEAEWIQKDVINVCESSTRYEFNTLSGRDSISIYEQDMRLQSQNNTVINIYAKTTETC